MFNPALLDRRHGSLNYPYLERLEKTLHYALEEHPRTLAIRVDLHLSPSWFLDDSVNCHPNLQDNLLTRFVCSVKAKIRHYRKAQEKKGTRAHSCTARYCWVREMNTAAYPHYHLVLFVNKDLFRGLGELNSGDNNLGNMIRQAWLSALDLRGQDEYRSLVHFPSDGVYALEHNQPGFTDTWNDLVFRLSYLAKDATKVYSPQVRSIGCSQK